DICNKIGIIERGKLLFDGDVESAIRQVRQRSVLTVGVADGRNGEAKGLLEQHSSVESIDHKMPDDVLIVTLREGISDGSALAEILVRNGYRLKMIKEEEIDLEDVFMGITKGITN
ncbi:MAG: hypothetical protein ACREEE_03550, partial [Dongiaceae bacterium]